MDKYKHSRLIAIGLSSLAILGRVATYISTPLWLDFYKTNSTNQTIPSNSTIHQVSPHFLLISQWTVCFVVSLVIYGIAKVFWPSTFTEVDKTYPKRYFVISGVSIGLSSVLFNYSVSGSRTPPYLQAILSNFNIPIQFITRFALLRKRPSLVKTVCAGVVMAAEVVCLLPSIVPGWESASARRDDGGATGAGAVLWPLCLVSSMIPFAITNTLNERSVQAQGRGGRGGGQLSMVYFVLWWTGCGAATVTAMFWVDVVPGVGTSPTMTVFFERFWYDLRCVVGACEHWEVALLGWICYTGCVVANYAIPALMRFSEGANFVIIVLMLRTPLLFIFWTLFDESPFAWKPHVHLGTYLSMAAIVVMLPAIVVYDRSSRKEQSQRREIERDSLLVNDEDEYSRSLVDSETHDIQT